MKAFYGIAVAASLACIAGAPVFAQSTDKMASDKMAGDKMAMSMSKSDMAMMKKCKAMPSAKMAKNAKCTDMMKMHSDMMAKDSMSKSDPMKH